MPLLDPLAEFFSEILFRRLIVRFFGFYTLLGLFRYRKGLQWIKKPAHDMDAFTGNCLVALTGLLSFSFTLYLVVPPLFLPFRQLKIP